MHNFSKISRFILINIISIYFFDSYGISQSNETGLLFLPEEEYKSIPLASSAMLGILPPNVDLSAWFPEAGNQGNQASCVAWAVGYGLKSYQEAFENKRRPISDNNCFSPSYIYNQIRLNDCGDGSYIKSALNLIKKEGVATLKQFPYDENKCSQKPSSEDKYSAQPYAIADWRTVSTNDEVDVKSHLALGFPVVIGMIIDEDFQRITGDFVYTGSTGNNKGGHAMVIVGYDDNRSAFKLLNSWGTNWGDNGFGWISYGAFKSQVREAYSAQDIIINDPNVKPNSPANPLPDKPVPTPSNIISASLLNITVNHDIIVNTQYGQFPGMSLNVKGSIINAVGSNAQLVIRFFTLDGQPIIANLNETFFRDIHGCVAVGSPVLPVVNNPASTDNATFAIPYYALNFKPSFNLNSYNIQAVARIYINNFEYSESLPTKMTIRF